MATTFVSVQGNLVDNPEHHTNTPGHELTKFRVAASGRRRTDQSTPSGQPIWQDVDQLYIDVECWGALAENTAVSLRKGFPVTVSGKLVTETWEDRNSAGETILRSKIKLKATQVGFNLSNFQVNSVKTTNVTNTLPGSEEMTVQSSRELYGSERRLSAEDGAARAAQLEEREPVLVGAGGGGALSFDDRAADVGSGEETPF